MSVCVSARPFLRLPVFQLGKARFSLAGFSWNFTFEHFSKICPDDSSFIKIWQELWVLAVATYVYLWYLAAFFFEW
jgi:hypothetical protein